MIEKELKLLKRITNALNKEEKEILNTSFVDIIEQLVNKLEEDKKNVKMSVYQESCIRTAPKFDNTTEEITAWAMGIAGEAGECCEVVKKAIWHNHPWDHKKLALELGDLMYYVSMEASAIGYTLDEVALMNIAKRFERYPNGFSKEDSMKRVDVK